MAPMKSAFKRRLDDFLCLLNFPVGQHRKTLFLFFWLSVNFCGDVHELGFGIVQLQGQYEA